MMNFGLNIGMWGVYPVAMGRAVTKMWFWSGFGPKLVRIWSGFSPFFGPDLVRILIFLVRIHNCAHWECYKDGA